jgi:hypothetical protein
VNGDVRGCVIYERVYVKGNECGGLGVCKKDGSRSGFKEYYAICVDDYIVVRCSWFMLC